jgi:hypothetical protein
MWMGTVTVDVVLAYTTFEFPPLHACSLDSPLQSFISIEQVPMIAFQTRWE